MDSLHQRSARLAELVDGIQFQDGVVHHNTTGHDDTDGRHQVQRMPEQPQRSEGKCNVYRDFHQHNERLEEALELRTKDEVHEQDGHEQNHGKFTYHLLVLMIQMGISLEDIHKELASRHVIDHKIKQEKNEISPVVLGETILPPFLITTNKGLTYCDNYKVIERNPETNEYLLDNGKEKLVLSAKTFESIINPKSAYPDFKQKETILYAENSPTIVQDKTIIPEFDGFCTGELVVIKDVIGVKKFLYYYFFSDGFLEIVNASTYGAKMPRASWDYIKNLAIPVPPTKSNVIVYSIAVHDATSV